MESEGGGTTEMTRPTQSRRKLVEGGWYCGAVAPFGYEVETIVEMKPVRRRRLAVNVDEAAVVREIFALSAGGPGVKPLGPKALAAQLNARGLKFRGHSWTSNRVLAIVHSPTHVGRHVTFKESKGRVLPENLWLHTAVPAIVDEKLWALCQASIWTRIAMALGKPPITASEKNGTPV